MRARARVWWLPVCWRRSSAVSSPRPLALGRRRSLPILDSGSATPTERSSCSCGGGRTKPSSWKSSSTSSQKLPGPTNHTPPTSISRTSEPLDTLSSDTRASCAQRSRTSSTLLGNPCPRTPPFALAPALGRGTTPPAFSTLGVLTSITPTLSTLSPPPVADGRSLAMCPHILHGCEVGLRRHPCASPSPPLRWPPNRNRPSLVEAHSARILSLRTSRSLSSRATWGISQGRPAALSHTCPARKQTRP